MLMIATIEQNGTQLVMRETGPGRMKVLMLIVCIFGALLMVLQQMSIFASLLFLIIGIGVYLFAPERIVTIDKSSGLITIDRSSLLLKRATIVPIADVMYLQVRQYTPMQDLAVIGIFAARIALFLECAGGKSFVLTEMASSGLADRLITAAVFKGPLDELGTNVANFIGVSFGSEE